MAESTDVPEPPAESMGLSKLQKQKALINLDLLRPNCLEQIPGLTGGTFLYKLLIIRDLDLLNGPRERSVAVTLEPDAGPKRCS